MTHKFICINLFVPIYLLLAVSCNSTKEQTRERLSFNEGWLFEKTEDTLASKVDYDDSNWRQLSVPHDWAIEGPFKPEYNPRTGGLPIFGKAWYRKHFVIDKSKRGSIVTIEFDGVMNNSTIYINGKKVYSRPYGYIGFQIDITTYIHFGEDNTVAVSVNPEALSARWYPGAGIYRNVWMEIQNPVHIKHWGTQIATSEITKDKAQVTVETKVINELKNFKGNYQIKTSLYDADSIEVSSTITDFKFQNNQSQIVQQLEIANPKLWDFESPHLYKAVSTIYKNNIAVDNYNTSFGIRTI